MDGKLKRPYLYFFFDKENDEWVMGPHASKHPYNMFSICPEDTDSPIYGVDLNQMKLELIRPDENR